MAIKLQKAVDMMLSGARLAQMHINNSTDTKAWFLIPGGRVTDHVAEKLLARPDIVQSGDAFFPGVTQTYRAVGRV